MAEKKSSSQSAKKVAPATKAAPAPKAATKKVAPAKKGAPAPKALAAKTAVVKKTTLTKKPAAEISAAPKAKAATAKKATPSVVTPEIKAPESKITPEVIIEKKTAPAVAPEPKKPVTPKPNVCSLTGRIVPPAPKRPPFVPTSQKVKEIDLDQVSSPPTKDSFHAKSFIDKQRQRLLDLQDSLLDAVSDMTRDTIRNAPEGSEASASGQHQGDAGSDAYDRDFALNILGKEQDALYEVKQALYRIDKGVYGICEISNKKIPQTRLEAIPFARLSVECQTQWEKEYGKRRYRSSNEVGFSGGNLSDDDDSEIILDEDED